MKKQEAVTYTDNEINRLENSINRTTKTGKRDYAIVLLASRLGMRSGDIVEMTFDTIDFNRDSINFIQNKTGQPLSLPLLPQIREAIAEYIQYARPNVTNNYMFIRVNAPFEKISTSIIRYALTKYFETAGINISNKKHGPHSLRSSMASSMVNSDVPYEVIRKVLGHTKAQAVKHYAKVDIENLRLHAIDVPAPTGTFAMVLQGREQLW
jgi:integrase